MKSLQDCWISSSSKLYLHAWARFPEDKQAFNVIRLNIVSIKMFFLLIEKLTYILVQETQIYEDCGIMPWFSKCFVFLPLEKRKVSLLYLWSKTFKLFSLLRSFEVHLFASPQPLQWSSHSLLIFSEKPEHVADYHHSGTLFIKTNGNLYHLIFHQMMMQGATSINGILYSLKFRSSSLLSMRR